MSAVLTGLLLTSTLSSPAGARWSSPEPITGSSWRNGAPQVVTDRQGGATVVWNRSLPAPNDDYHAVVARQRTAAGAWRHLRMISEDATASYLADVAVDDDGDAVVVWVDDSHGIHARTLGRGGALGTTRYLGMGFFPSVAVDGNGTAVVAWSAEDPSTPGGFGAQARRLSRSGRLGPVQDLGPADVSGPSAAMSRDGHGVVAWGQSSLTHVARLAPEGSWEAPQTVSLEGDTGQVQFPTAFVQDGGDATVLWATLGPADSSYLLASRVPSGGAPGAPFQVAPHTDVITYQARADDTGDLRVAWQSAPRPDHGTALHTRLVPVTGAMGEVDLLTSHVAYYTLAQRPSGSGLLMWGVYRSDPRLVGRARGFRADGSLGEARRAWYSSEVSVGPLAGPRYLAAYGRDEGDGRPLVTRTGP